MPYMFLEPVMGNLSAENWISSTRGATPDTRRVVERELSGTPVELRAVLGHTTLSMRQVLGLQVGDAIVLDKPAGSELILSAGGKARFLCKPGQVRGRKCVQVTSLIDREVGDVD